MCIRDSPRLSHIRTQLSFSALKPPLSFHNETTPDHTHPAAPSYRACFRWCEFDGLFPFLDIKFKAIGWHLDRIVTASQLLPVNYPFYRHSFFQCESTWYISVTIDFHPYFLISIRIY